MNSVLKFLKSPFPFVGIFSISIFNIGLYAIAIFGYGYRKKTLETILKSNKH